MLPRAELDNVVYASPGIASPVRLAITDSHCQCIAAASMNQLWTHYDCLEAQRAVREVEKQDDVGESVFLNVCRRSRGVVVVNARSKAVPAKFILA